MSIFNGIIYKITSPSGRVYIGQTNNLKRRINRYKNLKCENQRLLYNSFIKYGFENHNIDVILEINDCCDDLLNELEMYYIEIYKSHHLFGGMNLTLGGSGFRGTIPWNKGYGDYMRGEKNPMFGTISPMYGKKLTQEQKDKISKSQKGRARTDSEKNNLSIYFKNNPSNFKRVICTKTGLIFNTIREAADFYDIKSHNLQRYLNGTRKNKTTLKYYEE